MKEVDAVFLTHGSKDTDGKIVDPEFHLQLWLEGKLVHNGKTNEEGECLPDFSCCGCTPWPMELRQKFVNSDQRGREQMCMMALSAAIAELECEAGADGNPVRVFLSGDVEVIQ